MAYDADGNRIESADQRANRLRRQVAGMTPAEQRLWLSESNPNTSADTASDQSPPENAPIEFATEEEAQQYKATHAPAAHTPTQRTTTATPTNKAHKPRFGRREYPHIDNLLSVEIPPALKPIFAKPYIPPQHADAAADPFRPHWQWTRAELFHERASALQLYGLPQGLGACWFAILNANEKAPSNQKLTDQQLTDFIQFIFPGYTSKHAYTAYRWRNQYNRAHTSKPTTTTTAKPTATATLTVRKAHPDKPWHFSITSYPYFRYNRYTHPLPLPPHKAHRPTVIPSPLRKVSVIYRCTPSGKPIAQIHPNSKTTAVLLPHKYRPTSALPSAGGFYPEQLTPHTPRKRQATRHNLAAATANKHTTTTTTTTITTTKQTTTKPRQQTVAERTAREARHPLTNRYAES